MGRRGRQSSAARVMPNVTGVRSRLMSPAGLPRDVAAVFQRIVGACAADHFQDSDAPLLVEYCRAKVLADKADAELRRSGPVVKGKASAWVTVQEKAVRAMVALSMRLRISPQARMRPEKLGRTAQGPGVDQTWRHDFDE